MNRYILSAVLCAVVLSLCGCASSDVKQLATPIVSVNTAPADETGMSSVVIEDEPVPVGTVENIAADYPETEENAEISVTEESISTTSAVVSEENPPSDIQEEFPDEAREIFTETGEVLDTFYIDEYAAYDISAADREFTKRSIFVGDSICRGYSEYNVVGDKHVYARGNLGARSFYDYMFYYGEEQEEITYSEVLRRTEPEFVFLSMGMNDINMTTEEQFCENYSVIIDQTLAESRAAVYVCAITPVNSEFTSNYRVDCFNLRIKDYIEEKYLERVYFVDFGKHFRDEEGNLREVFSGGDGIHLSPYAYYVALWEMNRTTKADGLR